MAIAQTIWRTRELSICRVKVGTWPTWISTVTACNMAKVTMAAAETLTILNPRLLSRTPWHSIVTALRISMLTSMTTSCSATTVRLMAILHSTPRSMTSSP